MVTGVGVGVEAAQCCVYYDPGGGRGVLLCRPRKVVAGEEGYSHRGTAQVGQVAERGKELGPGVGVHGIALGEGGVLSLPVACLVLGLLAYFCSVLAQNESPATLLTEKWGGWATRWVLFSE